MEREIISSFTQQTWIHVSREWVMTLHKELAKIQALQYGEGILGIVTEVQGQAGRHLSVMYRGRDKVGPLGGCSTASLIW